MTEQPKCELCGEPMPKGEEVFRYHGYSGPCPTPAQTQPLPDRRDRDEEHKVTLSGQPADPSIPGAPQPINPLTGQHEDYYILSAEERSRGFVRPYRDSYTHMKCNNDTRMSRPIAETFATSPKFYGRTFCVQCGSHFPVGEFVWTGTNQVVGS